MPLAAEVSEVDKDALLFRQIEEPKELRNRRWYLFVGICDFVLAFLNGIKFWYIRDADHAINACFWLIFAVAWTYRSKHIAEPQITKLELNAPKEQHDA